MNYSILLFSQQDFFKDLVFEEILRERANYYYSKKKSINFWITLEPKLIQKITENPNFKKTNFFKRVEKQEISYACLISTNKEFIAWLKLRFGYFESLEEIPVKEFYSDGISMNFSNLNDLEKDFQEHYIVKNNLIEQYSYILNYFKEN